MKATWLRGFEWGLAGFGGAILCMLAVAGAANAARPTLDAPAEVRQGERADPGRVAAREATLRTADDLSWRA